MTTQRCKMCHRIRSVECFGYRLVRCDECMDKLAEDRKVGLEQLAALPPDGFKICFRCERPRPLEGFHVAPSGRIRATCKMCALERRRAERRRKSARLLNGRETEKDLRERRKAMDLHLRRHFKMTQEDYEALLEKQEGLCAICINPETMIRNGKLVRLAVDHCHVTGKVRGLACSNCNRALGLMGDDPALLRAAADYLERNA